LRGWYSFGKQYGIKTFASLFCFALLCTTCVPLRAIVVAVPPSLACLLHLLTQVILDPRTEQIYPGGRLLDFIF
jgi:hypothetical protein